MIETASQLEVAPSFSGFGRSRLVMSLVREPQRSARARCRTPAAHQTFIRIHRIQGQIRNTRSSW